MQRNVHTHSRATLPRLFGGATAAVAAVAAYMVFEAQWVQCRRVDLPVCGLPNIWSGTTILHLSDVHAGLFPTSERALRKVVDWAGRLAPDLVFLTGDILGDGRRSLRCLELLAHLRPALGAFAVTGNHEYGLGKGPLAHARHAEDLWEAAGITLLQDRCALVGARRTTAAPGGDAAQADGTPLAICGADYLSGGFGLLDGLLPVSPPGSVLSPSPAVPSDAFPILLIHEPPPPCSPLAERFSLAFAGHTHGGQLRVPSPRGLIPLNAEPDTRLGGVYDWGRGSLVVTRGIGTSFVPLRLLTRPEATLWRLV